jgi:hypothetical protein
MQGSFCNLSYFVAYMLDLIEYLFYFLQAKYKQWGELDIPKVYALAVISTLQIFNLLTLIVIGLILKIISVALLDKAMGISISIAVLIINYIYLFEIKGSEAIIYKFKNYKGNLRKIKNLTAAYFIVSVLSLLLVMTIFLHT